MAQLKDLHDFRGGLNSDDNPSNLPPSDYPDALNVRTGGSDEQHGEGPGETLQGEISILINPDSLITYYGQSIGGSFVYPGYLEVQIGNQVWMKKNWDGKYPGSKVYNDDENNRDVFGGLYTHDQILASDFCPDGWHVPTEAEVDILIANLLGAAVAGGKLKDIGWWNAPNTGASDSSGFKGMPGGGFAIGSDFVYDLLGSAGLLWLADEASNPNVIVDKDGNEYHVVTIGTQQWMVENLKTTKYADGTVIPNISNYNDWFLPSKDEFSKMRLNLYSGTDENGVVYAPIGGLTNNYYWCSTEITFIGAYCINNDDAGWWNLSKNTSHYVRAIRAFTSTTNYTLRDIGPAGGYVFYKSGNNYLEAAPSDQSTGSVYSNIINAVCGAAGTAIGTGQANTTAIINQALHTDSAAKLCNDLTSDMLWVADTTGVYCWYDNNIANKTPYGALYNWYAVNHVSKLATGQFTQGGLPSTGWRVPTVADTTILLSFLGVSSFAGGKLKETGNTHWASPNTGALNTYGFKALGGGFRRHNTGAFEVLTTTGAWWRATAVDANNAYSIIMFSNNANLDLALYYDKNYGMSVRCMRNIP